MSKVIKHVFLISIFSFSNGVVSGQHQNEQVLFFDSLVGLNNLGLIQGFEYEYPKLARETHPFLFENYWLTGDILFDQSVYYQVPLRFDAFNQEMIVQKNKKDGSQSSIMLEKEKIQWVKIEGQFFRKLPHKEHWLFQEHFRENNLGFYELHKKNQEVDQVTFTFKYKSDNRFYLMVNEDLFDFKNKKSIIDHFSNHKTKINQYIKTNKLKISPKNISDIKTLLSFCETL